MEKFILGAIIYALIGLVFGIKASRVAAHPAASPNGTTRASRVGWGVFTGAFWPFAALLYVANLLLDNRPGLA